jgi:hypothetical protein
MKKLRKKGKRCLSRNAEKNSKRRPKLRMHLLVNKLMVLE